MQHICIWPDGSWCEYSDRHQMTHMSDDFITVDTNADIDPDDLVQTYIQSGIKGVISRIMPDKPKE